MAAKNAPAVDNIGDAERNKNLEITIAQIEKEFGKGSIMRLGDSATYASDVHTEVKLFFIGLFVHLNNKKTGDEFQSKFNPSK